MSRVYCGYDHTFILTEHDEVYSFGRNSKGQLGIGNTVDQFTPQKVHLLCGKRVRTLLTNGQILRSQGFTPFCVLYRCG